MAVQTVKLPLQDLQLVVVSLLPEKTMCFGENNATHAAYLFNAQLGAHWDIASQCLKRHGSPFKPDERYQRSFSLAQFRFGSHRDGSQASIEDMMFSASFRKPSLEFLCNHDAVLRLFIEEGHYNLNIARASDQSVADKASNRALKQVEIALRVPFSFKAIRGQDSKIGNGLHTYSVLELGLLDAVLIDTKPTIPDARPALTFYLSQYLQLLHNSGQTVLLSLPDIARDGFRTEIDFSIAASSSVAASSGNVFGIAVDDINEYLTSRWCKVSMLNIYSLGFPDANVGSIVEYRNIWTGKKSDVYFHLNFGAPRVSPLCDKEAVLYLSLDEVSFYPNHDFIGVSRTYNDWELAIIMSLVEIRGEGGKVTGAKFTFKGSRFVSGISRFPGFDSTNKDAVRHRDRVIEFISTEYLGILESVQYNIIYEQNTEVLTSEPDSEDDLQDDVGGDKGVDLTPWKIAADKGEMFGFDQIVTVSHSVINAHFQTLWAGNVFDNTSDASISRWTYQEFFEATFKPITVHFLSNGRAVILIRINEGTLKLFKNQQPWSQSEKYKFSTVQVAFEVDVKMSTHSAMPGVTSRWTTRFESSNAFKDHGKNTNVTFNHIYLNLQDAQFVRELSRFDSLFTSPDKYTIKKVQAILTYLQSYYFPQLVGSGYHVLSTIPVWKSGPTLPPFALTSVTFRIHSKTEVTRMTYTNTKSSSQPVIVILGMAGGRPFPEVPVLPEWIVRPTKTTYHGSINISGRAFLDRLLQQFSQVNATTTIVPIFDGIDDEGWKLELVTWDKHPTKRRRAPKFVPVKGKGDEKWLRYRWQERDVWTHEHEGGGSLSAGAFGVSCITKNFLEIPLTCDSVSDALDIKVSGEIEFGVSFQGTSQKWSSKSFARWDATFSLQSSIEGLHVEILGAPVPEIAKAVVEGTVPANSEGVIPEKLFRNFLLSNTADFKGVLDVLKIFESSWSSCYPGLSTFTLSQPVFTRKGDLLFTLQPFLAVQQIVSLATPASAGVPRSPVVDPRSRMKKRQTL